MTIAATGFNAKTPIPAHVPAALVYEFDYINDPALVAEPHARMISISREAPPLFYTPYYGGHWVVCGKQLLADVTLATALFSNRNRGIPQLDKDINLMPLTLDPPDHTKYRMPLNRHLTPKAVAVLEDSIRELSNELIDTVVDRGGCNFLHQIAEPLPVILFMRMAGMPSDRVKEFRAVSELATASPVSAVRQKAFADIAVILSSVIKDRMAAPKDDLISHLLAEKIDGRSPTFEEMIAYAVVLFLGGLETVVNAISFSTRWLALNPQEQIALRANPSRIPVVVEELLRLHGIASSTRRVTQDTQLRGVQLKQNDYLMLLVPAANYDALAYSEPTEFRPGRSEAHVTFNMGPHRCVGANLARLELRIFFEEWLRRVPPFKLDPARPATFIGGLNLAVRSLDLSW